MRETLRKRFKSMLPPLPPFKKLTATEAYPVCPVGCKFGVKFTTKKLAPLVHQQYPGLTAQIVVHTAGGYCRACETRHKTQRRSLRLFAVLEWELFAEEFELPEEYL